MDGVGHIFCVRQAESVFAGQRRSNGRTRMDGSVVRSVVVGAELGVDVREQV